MAIRTIVSSATLAMSSSAAKGRPSASVAFCCHSESSSIVLSYSWGAATCNGVSQHLSSRLLPFSLKVELCISPAIEGIKAARLSTYLVQKSRRH